METVGRKILKYRVDTETPFLWSHLNNEYRWCESLPERNHILCLEFNQGIQSYNTQPFSVKFAKEDGSVGKYTPDVIERSEDGFSLTEVKSSKASNRDKILEKYDRIDYYCRKTVSMKLNIIFSEDQKIDNYLRLYKYRAISQIHFNNLNLRRLLPPVFSFQDLRHSLQLKGLASSIAFSLLAHQKISFDYTMPLKNSTQLEVA